MLRVRTKTVRLLGAIFLVAALTAGCGGSKSKSSATTAASHTTTAPATTSTSPGKSGASVTTSRLHATLSAPNHDPVAGKLWPYSVKVTDPSGKPVSGTVDTEFLFGEQVVGRESPPTHQLKNGALHDMVTWPANAVGEPLALRTVIHTSQGTVTLDWPVSVKR